MPRCKNCPPPPAKGYYYTGQENTPLGRGYSARFESEGTKMLGNNKNKRVYWVVSDGKWSEVKKKSSSSRNSSQRSNPKGGYYSSFEQPTEQPTMSEIYSEFKTYMDTQTDSSGIKSLLLTKNPDSYRLIKQIITRKAEFFLRNKRYPEGLASVFANEYFSNKYPHFRKN